MLRPVLSLLSPAGPRARLSILIFHRVLRVPDPLMPGEVDALAFDRICNWVAQWFSVLPLDQAVERLHRDDLPSRALAITFDDGYADNQEVALPILQRHGLCATFYVSTGFLDGGRMWNDTVIETVRRSSLPALVLADVPVDGLPDLPALPLGDAAQRRAAIHALLGALKYKQPDERLRLVQAIAAHAAAGLPDNLMMRSEQVRALHDAGMLIGAHTVSHPILAVLDPVAARDEIDRSRQRLQAITGQRVAHFAYPNGVPGRDFSDQTVQIVRDLGFDSAVTTGWGAARRGADPFQLPRFTPWDRSRTRFGGRLARNLLST